MDNCVSFLKITIVQRVLSEYTVYTVTFTAGLLMPKYFILGIEIVFPLLEKKRIVNASFKNDICIYKNKMH